MEPNAETLRARLPVWAALSEFFLDTELQDDDYARIARVLSASPYREGELWEILRFEVAPACDANLRMIAGEWRGFDEAFLKERIGPRCGRRSWWTRLGAWLGRGRYAEGWERVRVRVERIRRKAAD